ncbi:carboxymuconolactone decarboxylase family protein [Streptomyces sp. LE64]|uniref:carboxymuconolactone decarboxylase family protein n=1 Tax=Streptomyces sp. LE64 TaxID=3448653 RepID=UPI0040415E9B
MAPRIPQTELTAELTDDLLARFGVVPEPLGVLFHNPEVARTSLVIGEAIGGWDTADESLKAFAHLAVAAHVGCGFCLDLGYFQAVHRNLDPAKASQVPRWRESEVFTPLERDVMEYAEAVTDTPPTVTDELAGGLLDRIGPAAMVELTGYIAFANFAARSNLALGIEAQGFSASCEVPLAARPDTAGR